MCPPLKTNDPCEMIADQENPDPSRNQFSKDVAKPEVDQLAANSVCSSAKQHRKMQAGGLQGQGS